MRASGHQLRSPRCYNSEGMRRKGSTIHSRTNKNFSSVGFWQRNSKSLFEYRIRVKISQDLCCGSRQIRCSTMPAEHACTPDHALDIPISTWRPSRALVWEAPMQDLGSTGCLEVAFSLPV